ncbi:diacylglycerol kinase [Erysipelothrix larvae]|uniref:Diacylglycerol kinase n=1 Tax=Erysipelothrix larvae TaxID=1514105 RepID=A0A0X8GZN1_9FIRM|nr:diacylglycerol kinase [Erysipelothrix larvae]AMC93368.1 diacylglycerol kinase [Erysipelothrix larvae]
MHSILDVLKRTIYKFRCAFQGFYAGIRYDRSILIQVIFALISIILFSFIGISVIEWLFIISAIFIVLIAEFLNSAIEDICDLLIKKYDLHVKEIKDIAAAAVLLAALYAVVVGVVILGGKIL